jgi:CRP/FNR family transcriptional regulator, cyclic AMP receptor protein
VEGEELFRRFGREFPAGTVLFREGEPGQEMYVVQQGRVEIAARAGAVRKVLSTLGPGEFFGEMSILNGAPRSATATCAEDCRLLVVDARTLEAMIRQSGEVAVRMIQKLAARLAEADRQIELLMLRDARARVIHWVASTVERAGERRIQGVVPEEVASRLDVTPAQVRDVLAALERAGLVTVRGDAVEVPHPARLGRFLEFLQTDARGGGTR